MATTTRAASRLTSSITHNHLLSPLTLTRAPNNNRSLPGSRPGRRGFFLARYNTPTYAVGVARSAHGVLGPWEKLGDPILHVGDVSDAADPPGYSGPGHCSVLTRAADGRAFMVVCHVTFVRGAAL